MTDDSIETVTIKLVPAADPVGQAIRATFAAIDELIALAADPDTRDLVCAERVALGQLYTRCQTLASFAMATKPGPILVSERRVQQ